MRLLLLLLVAMLAGCGLDGLGEGEIHLLPAGYVGPVAIVFEQADGAPPERDERGWRVYRIPPNGVLRTRFGPNYGWMPPGSPAYYHAVGSERHIIRGVYGSEYNRYLNDPSAAPADTFVYLTRVGSAKQVWRCGRRSWSGPEDVAFRYNSYIVGPFAQADSLARVLEVGELIPETEPRISPDCEDE